MSSKSNMSIFVGVGAPPKLLTLPQSGRYPGLHVCVRAINTMQPQSIMRIERFEKMFFVVRKKKKSFGERIRTFGYKLLPSIFRTRFRKRQTLIAQIEELCAKSLSLVGNYSNINREDVNRAGLITQDIIRFVRSCNKGSAYYNFEKSGWANPFHEKNFFFEYVEQQHSIRTKAHEEQFGAVSDEFGGLLLYLATTFKGPDDWLARDGRGAVLVSRVYEALQSSIMALYKCAEELPDLDVKTQLCERIITEQLRQYGLAIKHHDLGDLKACLILGPFSSTVYLNESLPRQQWESACFHELGHYALRHRSNSEYGLDPAMLAPSEKDQFVRQEQEADGFAALWSHVLWGLIEYLMRPFEDLRNHQPQITDLKIHLNADEITNEDALQADTATVG